MPIPLRGQFSFVTLPISVAKEWHKIATTWYSYEVELLKIPYKLDKALRKRVLLLVTLFAVSALIEHLLSISVSIKNEVALANYCNWTIDNPLLYHAERTFKSFFEVFPENIIIFLVLQFMNICLTFSWNFMDLFIMVTGMILSTRFSQITKKMKHVQNGCIIESETFWHEVRLNYVKLCEIVELMDHHLAQLIPLSCLTNLYFICLQLMNISFPLSTIIDRIYFWYSLSFLIVRANCTLYLASKIDEKSQEPNRIISTIPNNGWCQELERFWYYINGWKTSLSGWKFFLLTRQLIFSVN